MLFALKKCKDWTDQELVRRSRADVTYFSCLYERYEESLLRYIQRLGLRDAQEAQDVLQNAFIKAWKYLNTFDERMKYSSWLYRIVHNETVSCLRKKASLSRQQRVSFPGSSPSNADGWEESDKWKVLEEQDQHIHVVLDQLSLKYKEVLVLKFLENRSYEEISDILKIPEGTVATRINRAKKAFRKIAQGDELLIS